MQGRGWCVRHPPLAQLLDKTSSKHLLVICFFSSKVNYPSFHPDQSRRRANGDVALWRALDGEGWAIIYSVPPVVDVTN